MELGRLAPAAGEAALEQRDAATGASVDEIVSVDGLSLEASLHALGIELGAALTELAAAEIRSEQAAEELSALSSQLDQARAETERARQEDAALRAALNGQLAESNHVNSALSRERDQLSAALAKALKNLECAKQEGTELGVLLAKQRSESDAVNRTLTQERDQLVRALADAVREGQNAKRETAELSVIADELRQTKMRALEAFTELAADLSSTAATAMAQRSKAIVDLEHARARVVELQSSFSELQQVRLRAQHLLQCELPQELSLAELVEKFRVRIRSLERELDLALVSTQKPVTLDPITRPPGLPGLGKLWRWFFTRQ